MLDNDDIIQIMQLVARYNHALDFGDPEGWAETFTPDGSIQVPPGRFAGRPALVEFARNFQRQFGGTRHWTNNLLLETSGDSTRLRCYLWLVRNGTGETVWTGHYDDTLVKLPEGWRFSARRVSTP